MGRDYRFIAIEGDGECVDPVLDRLGLERDPYAAAWVLGANHHPIPGGAVLIWTRYAGGTLLDFRNLVMPIAWNDLIVDTEVGENVDLGEPLFDAGRASGGGEWFEYPEWTPALALEWFLGFSAYDWSDLRFDGEGCPSSMNVTPVRKQRG